MSIPNSLMTSSFNWNDALFPCIAQVNDEAVPLGQRLGISYIRSQQECVVLDIGDGKHTIKLYQSSMGLLAISGVVWDAGLFLVDFIIQQQAQLHHQQQQQQQQQQQEDIMNSIVRADCILINRPLGDVLDLGCGLGIGGIAASYLHDCNRVVLSDTIDLTQLHDNINAIEVDAVRDKITFVQYKWGDDLTPVINDRHWNTVLCSDLLYDSKYYSDLLCTIAMIKFDRLILSYKKRNEEKEILFFESLSVCYTLRVVDSLSINVKNISRSSLSNLHIIIVEPK